MRDIRTSLKAAQNELQTAVGVLNVNGRRVDASVALRGVREAQFHLEQVLDALGKRDAEGGNGDEKGGKSGSNAAGNGSRKACGYERANRNGMTPEDVLAVPKEDGPLQVAIGIAWMHGLPWERVIGRSGAAVLPKRVRVEISKRLHELGVSSVKIGHVLRRDHSTVLEYLKQAYPELRRHASDMEWELAEDERGF